MSDLVAVAAYLDPPEAHILRGRLNSEGIFAVVADENNYLNPWYTAMGARVLVRLEDFQKALEIKKNDISATFNYNPGSDPVGTDTE